MNQTGSMGQRITADYDADQLILALARAGDTHAMRCMAARAPSRLIAELTRKRAAADPGSAEWTDLRNEPTSSVHEAIRREKLHWHTQAAQQGDLEAKAELNAFRWQEHEEWHGRRRFPEPGQAPAGTAGLGTPDPQNLDLCRAGALNGSADCIQVWAAHLRSLGPRHEAEAREWQERAKAEQHRKHDLRSSAADSIAEQPMGNPGGLLRLVIAAAAIDALVPFIQQMAIRAADDGYNALRAYLRDLFRRSIPSAVEPDGKHQLVVPWPPEGDQPSALVGLWTDLPDEAIAALTQLLEDLRNAPPAKPGTGRFYYWDPTAHRWKILNPPPAKDRELPETSPSQVPRSRL